MIPDVITQYSVRQLLETYKRDGDKEPQDKSDDQQQFSLLWVEQHKDEFNKFKNQFPHIQK